MEEVCISLPEDSELQPVGTVSSIIQQLGKYTHTLTFRSHFSFYGWISNLEKQTVICVSPVIIQSLKDMPALTDDSILFRSDRLALGKVGEPAQAVCMTTFTFVNSAFLHQFVLILLVSTCQCICLCFRCSMCLAQCPVHYIFCVLTLKTISTARG